MRARYSMCRIVIAPCSPFSVTPDLMRASAAFARERGLTLHTHVAETLDEEAFCLQKFGVRPVELMGQLDWVGPDVWWAHCVHLSDDEIALMADTGTGVAHCPSSNMRLGSGIAPVRAMHDRGVKVGLAVDGSASNDSGHMLAEARQAMLLQRVKLGASALSAEDTLWLGTRGGAAVLGRDDIGALAPGMAADFIGVDLKRLAFAGAQADPLATLLFCTPPTVDLSVINGRVVVAEGELLGLDLDATVARHNEMARELLERVRGQPHRHPAVVPGDADLGLLPHGIALQQLVAILCQHFDLLQRSHMLLAQRVGISCIVVQQWIGAWGQGKVPFWRTRNWRKEGQLGLYTQTHGQSVRSLPPLTGAGPAIRQEYRRPSSLGP